jgi:hypothetical protein
MRCIKLLPAIVLLATTAIAADRPYLLEQYVNLQKPTNPPQSCRAQ